VNGVEMEDASDEHKRDIGPKCTDEPTSEHGEDDRRKEEWNNIDAGFGCRYTFDGLEVEREVEYQGEESGAECE
jgi:hypothetical protein